uniref:Kinesin-like protein n=1 Tax=Ascaris lumbricoides TaxID=6252 RepID=A0A9J2P1A5_ASCLU
MQAKFAVIAQKNDYDDLLKTVVLRVRPLNEAEKAKKHFQCVIPLDSKRVLLVDPEKFERNILRQNRQYEKYFSYDATFGPSSSQMDVHSATTAQIVEYIFLGYNATVFAYGPTGSGKTYTMVGTRSNPGLMTLLTQTLYERIDVQKHSVYLSYMVGKDVLNELYNENIRDLLNPCSGILDLMEDEKGNIQVPGLSKVIAPNSAKIMQILQEGNARRTHEATAINKSSSRSHALLQVSLYKRNVACGKLYLIDLAGSERASQTQNRGIRLKEGAAINRSLLALGNVINSLSSGNRSRYVNYRDSKLTRLLKDSLGGNSKTCMIAHVTPSSAHYEETYNTLVYASRAMNITLRTPHHFPLNETVDDNIIDDIARKTAKRSKACKFMVQYKAISEKYYRERLLEANQEAYEAEMSRASKVAILSAWNKQKIEVRKNQKTADSIARLTNDVDEQDKRLSELVELRRKIEKALRKGSETALSVESRLRSAAKHAEQLEMVALLVRMAEADAEKNNREQLQQEYRIIKNQIQFSLLPLRQNTTIVSWNTELLNRSISNRENISNQPQITHLPSL